MSNFSNYYPKYSDKEAVIYYEGSPTTEKLYNPLFKAIVSLGNTAGGQIIVVKKIPGKGANKTKYQYIPHSQIDECTCAVKTAIEKISKLLEYNPVIYWGHDCVDIEKQLLRIEVKVENYTDGLLSYEDKAGRKTEYYRNSEGNILPISAQCKSKEIGIKIIKHKIKNGKHHTIWGQKYELINIDQPIGYAYKYMTMDVFLSCLEYGTLRMQEPTNWKDQYEGRFYNAIYDNITNEPLPKLYATCITSNPASEAAWKVYAHGTGLGARCVQVKLNMAKLREQLCNGSYGDYYEGRVFYDLTDSEIDHLHETGSPYHSLFFSKFGTDKFVRLMLIKRQAYQYENEIRLFLINPPIDPVKPKDYYDAKVNWKDIIEEIRIDHSCTNAEILTLKYLCTNAGLKLHLPSKKGKIAKDEIPVTKVNIDRMKGKKRIRIQKPTDIN